MNPKMRVAFRGYGGGVLLFEEQVDASGYEEIERAIPELASKHMKILVRHPLHMMEIEFLDEENPLTRFHRFGTDRSMMVTPLDAPVDDGAMCHCGIPLHYSDPRTKALVEMLVSRLGPTVEVIAGGRRWKVPRHFIALHGLKADEIAGLGFEEIEEKKNGNSD